MASWTKARNEKQEKLFQEWKLDVQNVLVASKTGIDTRKLEADLEENIGKCPVDKMGFSRWGEFLYAIRDIFHVGHFYQDDPQNPRTRLFLFINEGKFRENANEDVLAIAKLVREQEKAKTKKRSDGTTNAPTLRQVRMCDAAYLLGKTSTTEFRAAMPPPGRPQFGRPRGASRGGGGIGGKSFPSFRGGGGGGSRPSSYYEAYGAPKPKPFGGFSGGSSSYNSRPRPLIPVSPPRIASRRLNVCPSGFESDEDDFDDGFDYCGGPSRDPKLVPEDEWSNPPIRSVDVVDNPRPIQPLIKPVTTLSADRPKLMKPVTTQYTEPTRPKFKFAVPQESKPVLAIPVPVPVKESIVATVTPKPAAIPNGPIENNAEKITMKPKIGPPNPMKPYSPPSTSDRVLRVNEGRSREDADALAIPKLMREQEKAETTKGSVGTTNVPTLRQVTTCDAANLLGKASAPGIRAEKPRPTFQSFMPPKPSPLLPTPAAPAPRPASNITISEEIMSMKPTTGPPKPMKPYTPPSTSDRVLRVNVDPNYVDQPVMLKPSTAEARAGKPRPTFQSFAPAKPSSLLPAPAPRPASNITITEKITTMKPTTGPPKPMQPYTPPSTSDRVLRVSVDPNFVEQPVMLKPAVKPRPTFQSFAPAEPSSLLPPPPPRPAPNMTISENITAMKPTTGPPQPMKPYTPPSTSDRVLRVSVNPNYVDQPVMLKPSTTEVRAEKPRPTFQSFVPAKPSTLLPTPAPNMTITEKITTGPPKPMQPYTSTSDRVLRVSVEPNCVEEPVMLNRGPAGRGRGRPLCRNGFRPVPTFYDEPDCEIDNELFNRLVKIKSNVEQVRRLQFAEL